MKKILAILLLTPALCFAQEGERPPDVNQNVLDSIKEVIQRQDVVASEQRLLRGELGELRQRIIQLNFNILSWQDAQVQAAAGTNLSKIFTSYGDNGIKLILGLACLGILFILYIINRMFSWVSSKG